MRHIENKHIHIIGGDKRQVFLQQQLAELGYSVSITGFEQLCLPCEKPDNADFVFLPVPYLGKDGYIKAPFANRKLTLGDIVAAYPQSMYVLGRCDSEAKKLLGDRVLDLLADEAFLIDNAVLTAEAAVCAYLNASDASLTRRRCVVIGYGRIGKALCTRLKAYTCDIIATARKQKDLSLVAADGLEAVHTNDIGSVLKSADVVFNTVPHHVLHEVELRLLKEDACVIELASAPYGMDMMLAKHMEIDVRIESGLPGRYFPKSAAAAMVRAFERYIETTGGE